jgi:hypothetical protein
MGLASDIPTFSSLPREICRQILTSYCDYSDLENIWRAVSANRQQAELFWDLLNQVLDLRIAKSARSTELINIADSLLVDLEPRKRNFAFRQRLNILSYTERLGGVLWCGHMEFKDPLMPDWRARTVKVVLRCDEENWSWNHAVGWDRCFSRTIKLVSQLYNFIPVRPRGEIFGVTPQDQEIIQEVSRQLQSRDQVMTLRFGNANGFILRIISPSQAQQRLARFAGNPLASFDTSADALVCSWECPPMWEDNSGLVPLSKKIEAINGMVQEMEGMAA